MSKPVNGQRGPADHERRDQILAAAIEYFTHYGYEKTTMSDLARAVGVSKAYIYKFFDSKKAVGETICGQQHGKMRNALQAVLDQDRSASERMRGMFLTLAHSTVELFFNERKMYDIVYSAVEEQWAPVMSFEATLRQMIEHLIRDGRASAEFERKTPMDETCRAITLLLHSIYHPVLLSQRLETLDADAQTLASLVLRSLAP